MKPKAQTPSEIDKRGTGTRQWSLSAADCPLLKERGILFLGYSEARAGYEVLRQSPDFSNVNVTLSGSGEMLIDGKWHTISPGMAALSPRDALQGARKRSRGRWEFCWVCFEEKRGRPGRIRLAAPAVQFVDPRPIAWAIQGLERELRHGGQRTILEAWLRLLDLQVERIAGPAPAENRLWPLWEAVAQTPAHPWTEEEMGRLAQVGPRQLLRLCRKESGRTLRDQLAHLRLAKAAALLQDRGLKLQVVAERVGYQDAFSFSKAFKRWSGKSPREYRR